MSQDTLAEIMNKLSTGNWVVVYQNSEGNTEYLTACSAVDQFYLASFAHRLAGLAFDESFAKAKDTIKKQAN